MSQLFGQQHFAAQYFNTKYLHGNNQSEPTARSGWFRLLLSELQEEALKEDEHKKQPAVAKSADLEPSATQSGAARPTRRVADVAKTQSAIVEASDQTESEEPPVRLKPMLRPIVVEWPDPSAVAHSAVEDAEQWVKDFYKAATEYKAMLDRLRERLERDVAQIQRKKRRRLAVLLMAMA